MLEEEPEEIKQRRLTLLQSINNIFKETEKWIESIIKRRKGKECKKDGENDQTELG